MANTYFQFKEFRIEQGNTAMKVTTDGCLLGAWAVGQILSNQILPATLLDIGTGTGLLSLMLAQQINTSIDAVEIEPNAAEQARSNILHSPWKDRVQVICSDVMLLPGDKKYDVIISNPPFYENDLQSVRNEKNLAHHSDGLTMLNLFIIIAARLKPGGHFFILLPFRRKEEAEKKFTEAGLQLVSMEVVRPVTTHPPFRLLIHGSAGPGIKTLTMDRSIKDSTQQYTPWFKELLKDYYLHL